MTTKPHLLVTGAGGFCGEHACAYFVQQGYQVTGTLRPHSASHVTLPAVEGLQYVACDLTNPHEVGQLIARTQPTHVLHFAGVNAVGPSWTDPADTLSSNLMSTVRLMEAVRRMSAQGRACRIIVAGSMLRFPLPTMEERPEPPHPYSFSKTLQVLAARSWVSLYGMDILVAEPSNLIGPGRSKGIAALLANYAAKAELAAERGEAPPAPFRLSSRTEQRDLLDVRDAIRAYEILLQHGVSGEVYPIASGVMVTLGELADQVAALAASPLDWEVGQSDAPSPAPVDTAALAALGWKPQIPLAQSLADTLTQMRQAAHARAER